MNLVRWLALSSFLMLLAACGDDGDAVGDAAAASDAALAWDAADSGTAASDAALAWDTLPLPDTSADSGTTASDAALAPDAGMDGPPPPICGDGVVEGYEECDDGAVPGSGVGDVTCTGLGFEDGWVTCTTDTCLLDVSECSICGDGMQTGYEQCDGLDFGGARCDTLGFDGGDLACNLAQCAFVYSSCTGGEYSQDFEASATMPTELDVDAVAPWTVSELAPINGSRSARSGAMPQGGITNLTLTAAFPAGGAIQFFHRESTAPAWDYLRFYRDGVLQQSWTGENPAGQYSAPVPAGSHTFQWRFERASFASQGENAAWVDDITLVGGVPI